MNQLIQDDPNHVDRPNRGDRPSGRLRIPALLVALFGGASLLSAELFSNFTENGAPFALTLVALLPLQAVGLIWFLNQRQDKGNKKLH
jgi:hypothetical protein